MVGILKADVVPQGTSSYGWSGAYGWSLGVNGQLYEDGVNKGSGHPWKKLSKQYIKSLSIFGKPPRYTNTQGRIDK